MNHSPFINRLCQAAAATLIALLSGLPAAAQVSQAASAESAPRSLHIVILDGENALNNIRERTAREPIIQVEDENHKPVSGAAVLFLIHSGDNGAGATFANGATSFSTKTGPDGKAQAQGLQTSQTPGSFTIAVTVTVGALVAETVIHQQNVITALNTLPAKTTQGGTASRGGLFGLSKTTTIIIGGAIIGGVIGGVVAATNGGSSTTIGTGTGTVGPPTPGSRRIH